MATGALPGMMLDSPPPLPPSLAQTQAPPQMGASPSMGALAGPANMGSGGVAAGAAIQSAMAIEAQIISLTRMLPGFAPAADQIIQLLRSGVVQASQGQPAPASPLGTASMASPVGAGGSIT